MAETAIREAIDNVLESGWYILGPKVEEFEAAFADYCGVEAAVGVANGADAIELALRATDVGEGDEVITTANACMYSTLAILATGAKPVFVDIDPLTGLVDPGHVLDNISPATSAIIATHLYGKLADIATLRGIIGEANIVLIEDAAQAHGAHVNGRRAGSLGDVACFSFYPTKNLGALGDGGAITTNSKEIAAKARQLRQYGWNRRFECELPGGRNSRLDEIQAAVLLAKLPFLEEFNRQRKEIASRYVTEFSDLPVDLPSTGEDHVFHLFVIQHSNRDKIISTLRKNAVSADIHYPIPDYRQKAIMAQLGSLPTLAGTEKFVSRIVTLPCFPGMTEKEISVTIKQVSLAVQAPEEN
jgi:dTDP-3-amino-2,3,6-trideoxy-4-keto-D-glucose/dTDP-3-amino-3,4,6-trideoxy-alpha-D-glucose/dTDP-2,6-dideoxy-D-kanosamine transaminase